MAGRNDGNATDITLYAAEALQASRFADMRSIHR